LKKEAKTFSMVPRSWWRRIRGVVGAVTKVFWFFFSKKNYLSYLAL
jgi:hypothetical protein